MRRLGSDEGFAWCAAKPDQLLIRNPYPIENTNAQTNHDAQVGQAQ